MNSEAFVQDCVALGRSRLMRGELGRRQFLEGLAMLGLAPVALGARVAAAQGKPKEIIVANWGGAAVKNQYEAWGKPYEQDTGIKVIVDGTGPARGKIRAMVDAKHVTWDVCDSDPNGTLLLGRAGVLDEFDYSVVDRNKVPPGFAFKWGIANYLFSYVLTYDKTKFGNNPPQSWKDFWNIKEYPGKRAMFKSILGAFEVALMADGVPLDAKQLYPPDEKRAWEMLKRIKPHTIFWSNGAQSEQLLRDGECAMGSLWNSRTIALHKDTNGRIDFTWNQGLLSAGAWVVPKGNPAGKWAYDFIRSTQIPERQINLLAAFGAGPANPAAAAIIPADLRRFSPGDPQNARLQVPINHEWYADNYERLQNQFIDIIGS